MISIRQFESVRTGLVLSIALAASLAIIALVSKHPVESIVIFLVNPLNTLGHIGNVVEMTIPLAFAGLSVSLLFRANLFNLGAEGLFYASGVVAAAVAIQAGLGPFVHPLVAILLGGVTGAVLSAIPGILKARWNASELVTSLMFNSILLGVGLYILNYFLRDAAAFATVSFRFQPDALLPKILPGTRIHLGLLILLAAALATHWYVNNSKGGYELRMTGANREFAEYSGIKTAKVIIVVHVIAGFLAGVGGSVEVLGMYTRFQWVGLPGYGFDGALVAMLAKNRPLAVLGSAVFLAYIRIGADQMARFSDVPSEMVAIVQALIILLISADHFLANWKNRLVAKEAKVHE